MVFDGTLEELELLAEGGGVPLTLVGFSLKHREPPVLEQAPMEFEDISGGSPEEDKQLPFVLHLRSAKGDPTLREVRGKCREISRQVGISHLQKIHLYCFSGGLEEYRA